MINHAFASECVTVLNVNDRNGSPERQRTRIGVILNCQTCKRCAIRPDSNRLQCITSTGQAVHADTLLDQVVVRVKPDPTTDVTTLLRAKLGGQLWMEMKAEGENVSNCSSASAGVPVA
jgi:hypothetical protein